MNAFGDALKQFKRDGFFIYQGNYLTGKQL